MRTIQESLYQEMPGETPLADVMGELSENLGIAPWKTTALAPLLTNSVATVTTASQLMDLDKDTVVGLCTAAGMIDSDVLSLRICLGSLLQPFEFKTALQLVQNLAKSLHSTTTIAPVGAAKAEKGGIQHEASERMPARRPPIESYYPPSCFDAHRKGLPTRNEPKLRQLIVQEIKAVCGDLYPTANERASILGSIEAYCGPPSHTYQGHFDNWREEPSNRKHKGTSISDLEKARCNPAAWGVTKQADRHPLRPLRPERVAPLPLGWVQHSAPPSLPRSTADGPPAEAAAKPAEAEDIAGMEDLMPSDSLLEKCAQLQQQVADLRQQQQANKAVKKAAAAAARQAAKAAKPAAKGKGKGQKRKAATAEAAAEAAGEAGKDESEAAGEENGNPQGLSAYEKKRLKSIAENNRQLQTLGLAEGGAPAKKAKTCPPAKKQPAKPLPEESATLPPYQDSELFKTHPPRPFACTDDLKVSTSIR